MTDNTGNTAQPTLAAVEIPAGIIRHAGRTYTVHAIACAGGFTGENGRSLALAILRGTRGAEYLVTDNGPRHYVTGWNMGTRGRTRNLMETPFLKYPITRDVVVAALSGEGR